MSPKQKTLNGKNAVAEKKHHRKSKSDSEFQSYTYIKNELKDKGWNISNPNRDASGQLYTQHECLQNREIASKWGRLHPEYVVKLAEDAFWAIEAKPRLEDIEKAFEEAKWYGKLLNEHQFIRSMIVSGVAGNDIDKYLVKSAFWVKEKKDFDSIIYDGKEITSILTPEIAKRLLDEKTPVLKEFDIPDDQLLKAADDINKKFHEAGIRKDKRATIVATMLLSLLGETEPNYNDTPDVFVNDINSRAKEALKKNGKEQFFRFIEIPLPEKPDAKNRFKEALVEGFFVLRKINIKAAMRTGSDVLGRFYETFLKYGNGAKDLGIVLTPRHITEFAAEVLNVTHNDIVYDPTCGTGGFLVSCFYRVRSNSNQSQLDAFRLYRIFGVDLQSSVSTLAIVNMIFRGDGRNNIINDDCFTQGLIDTKINNEVSAKFVSRDEAADKKRVVTKVLMNPPFALKKSAEKEYRFIDHALEQMEDSGLLFSILPCSTMVKAGSYKKWRRNMLKKNTLLSVITFVEDLFYPQSQPPPLALIIKKGIPHPQDQNVLWIRVRSDGYRKIKGKRLKSNKVPDELNMEKTLVQSFLVNPNIAVQNIPELQKAYPIDFSDSNVDFELVPEAYLDAKPPTTKELEEGMQQTVREYLAFLIRSSQFTKPIAESTTAIPIDHNTQFEQITVVNMFTPEKGFYHVSAKLDSGVVPLISCSAENMGIEGYFDIKDYVHSNSLTVASDGTPLTTFYHCYEFAAKDNVIILKPKKPIRLSTILFVALQLNRMRWRFNYGRKCYSRKFKRIAVFLPVKNSEIDGAYIEKLCEHCYGWKELEGFMQNRS